MLGLGTLGKIGKSVGKLAGKLTPGSGKVAGMVAKAPGLGGMAKKVTGMTGLGSNASSAAPTRKPTFGRSPMGRR